MTRVSPPEEARELPGPQASTSVTLAPRRRSIKAVHPPNAPAPEESDCRGPREPGKEPPAGKAGRALALLRLLGHGEGRDVPDLIIAPSPKETPPMWIPSRLAALLFSSVRLAPGLLLAQLRPGPTPTPGSETRPEKLAEEKGKKPDEKP